ncbi:MAG: RNA polymerase sigma factor [Planctomycetota bacterium]
MGDAHHDAELATHFDFARRLAARLVGESDGDDVVQDAYVAALTRPPRDPAAGRAFLRSVVRRTAGRARRARRRREEHEGRAAPSESAPPTDELAAAMEMHRIVVSEIMKLRPTYREVVLLRCLEDLSTRAVAARLGLRFETVRTRLKRAFAELRSQLARRDPEWRQVLGALVIQPRRWRGKPFWLAGGLALAAAAFGFGWFASGPDLRGGTATPTRAASFRLYLTEGQAQATLAQPVLVRVRDANGAVAEQRIRGTSPFRIAVAAPGNYSVQLTSIPGFEPIAAFEVHVSSVGLSHTSVPLRRRG